MIQHNLIRLVLFINVVLGLFSIYEKNMTALSVNMLSITLLLPVVQNKNPWR